MARLAEIVYTIYKSCESGFSQHSDQHRARMIAGIFFAAQNFGAQPKPLCRMVFLLARGSLVHAFCG
jgi:hypothetical protein